MLFEKGFDCRGAPKVTFEEGRTTRATPHLSPGRMCRLRWKLSLQHKLKDVVENAEKTKNVRRGAQPLGRKGECLSGPSKRGLRSTTKK